MAKERVYNNSGEIFGVTINELGIFTADLAVVIVFFTAGLLLKDRTYRYPMWTCAGLYLIFALIWHSY